ncbi:MAG: hypothetical protein ABI673_05330 [Novosphingobium sp.]
MQETQIMERHGNEIHVTTDEARAGQTPHVVRYVLSIGLMLVIVAFAVIWLTGSMSNPNRNTVETSASGNP